MKNEQDDQWTSFAKSRRSRSLTIISRNHRFSHTRPLEVGNIKLCLFHNKWRISTHSLFTIDCFFLLGFNIRSGNRKGTRINRLTSKQINDIHQMVTIDWFYWSLSWVDRFRWKSRECVGRWLLFRGEPDKSILGEPHHRLILLTFLLGWQSQVGITRISCPLGIFTRNPNRYTAMNYLRKLQRVDRPVSRLSASYRLNSNEKSGCKHALENAMAQGRQRLIRCMASAIHSTGTRFVLQRLQRKQREPPLPAIPNQVRTAVFRLLFFENSSCK